MQKVMAFGTFDPLHEGHLHLFSHARTHGDHLTVIISRDSTIRKIKGREPFQNEATRLIAVQQSGLVDHARLGYEDDVYHVLSEEQPDIICLGYDQTHFVDRLASEMRTRGLNARIIRAPAHDPHIHKSTLARALYNETHK